MPKHSSEAKKVHILALRKEKGLMKEKAQRTRSWRSNNMTCCCCCSWIITSVTPVRKLGSGDKKTTKVTDALLRRHVIKNLSITAADLHNHPQLLNHMSIRTI